jgi:hypothetical protein
LAYASCHAQWKTSVGINLPPIIAKSAEISSEFSRHPGYSLNLNLGHTFKTAHTGLIDYKVYDGVSQRRTSGTFLKAGAKLYPMSISRKQKRNQFFIGAYFILSQFRQTALQRELSEDLEFSNTYTPVSMKERLYFLLPLLDFNIT